MIAFTSVPADPYWAMLRAALVPAAAVGLLSVGLGLLGGPRDVAGAALGAGLVIGFFGLTLLVMRAARRVAPEMLLGVALALYSTKIAVVGGIVFWLRDQPWLSPTALAVTAIACATAWLTGQVVGFTRLRLPLVDPDVAADR